MKKPRHNTGFKKPLLRAGYLLLTVSLLLVITIACNDEDNNEPYTEVEQQSSLFLMADGNPLAEGGATLTRTPNSITMTIDAQDLWPDQTYTIWWVIFNNPEPCESGMSGATDCGEEDLFVEPVGGTVLFADGELSDAEGRAQFVATLGLEDISGCQPPFDSFEICRGGLENPMGAEVHLVVRSHGEAIPGMTEEQLQTFAGGCTPESSFDAGNGPNECVDMQFAVFRP